MTSKQIAFVSKSTTITALEQYRICSPLDSLGLIMLMGKNQSVILQEMVDRIRAIVIQRDFSRDVNEFNKVITIGKQNNIPVVLDLDDYLFELPLSHPMRKRGIFADALLPLLNSIIQVDAVTVTTNVLRSALLGINPSIYVLPNYLDPDLWQFQPVPEPIANRPVRIVFIGTPTHQPDIESINGALVSIANKYGDQIEFMFIGTNPSTGLKNRSNVVTQPGMIYDYRMYVESVQKISADIAIAPLESNFFNQCKSAIKYYEYASLGIPGVYAHLDPYQDVIRDGQNGFLAKTTEDWISVLSKMIENPMLRLEIAENAQQDVKERWLVSDHHNDWAIAYEEICTNKQKSKPSDKSISTVLDLIQVQRNELEWLRAKRQYTAAKTIVQQRGTTNQLQADVYRLQQLQLMLEEANQKLSTELSDTQQAQSDLQTKHAQLEQQMVAIEEANQKLSTELSDTQQAQTDLQTKHAQLEQQKLALEDQEQRRILQLNYLRNERERLSTVYDHLRSQNFNLRNELDLTKQEVVDYALSSSWKLTRPLRSFKRKLRRS